MPTRNIETTTPTPSAPEPCSWCAKGDRPDFLDQDGTLCSITGEAGTLAHAYDDSWWPCLKFGVEVYSLPATPPASMEIADLRCLFCPGIEMAFYWLPDSDPKVCHVFCCKCNAAGPWCESETEAIARHARVHGDSGGGGDLISRAEAKKAICSRCARPERYRPAEPIEGSTRLFHFQIADNWNSGQCDAQVLDSVPTAVAEPTESQAMQNICYAYRQAAPVLGELAKRDPGAWKLLGDLEEAVKAAEAIRPIYPPAEPADEPQVDSRGNYTDGFRDGWKAHFDTTGPTPPAGPETHEVTCPDCVEGKITAGCAIDKPLISVDCGTCKGTGRVKLPTISLPFSSEDVRTGRANQQSVGERCVRERLSDAEFYARGIARSRYHDKLFAEGKPRPTNEQFDEGWAAGRAYVLSETSTSLAKERTDTWRKAVEAIASLRCDENYSGHWQAGYNHAKNDAEVALTRAETKGE